MNLTGSIHVDLTAGDTGGGLKASVVFVAADGSEYELLPATDVGPGGAITIDGVDAEITMSTTASYNQSASGPNARQPAVARPTPAPAAAAPTAPGRRGR